MSTNTPSFLSSDRAEGAPAIATGTPATTGMPFTAESRFYATDRPQAPISTAELRILQLLADELAREDCVGFTALVQLVEGDQSAEALLAMKGRIASAFKVGVQHVELLPDTNNNSVAHLTVAFPDGDGKHPLDHPARWRRPTIDPESGIFIHGRKVDGGKVHVRAYDRVQGMKLWWVNGSTNGGKSTVVDRVLVELCSTGMFVPFVIDMKGGASLGDWRDRVPFFVAGDPDNIDTGVQALSGLRGFKRMTTWRTRQLGLLKNPDGSAAKVLPLSPLCPAPILVLEEVPDLWPLCGIESVEIVEYLARNVRAVMETLLLASQDTSIGRPGTGAMGGSNVLRRQLRSNGNVVMLRNSKEAGGQAGEQSAIPIDPSQIPAIAGANYVTTTLDQAPELNRGLWVQNVFHAIEEFVQIPDMGAAHMDALARGSLAAFEEGRNEYLREWHDAQNGQAGQPSGPRSTTKSKTQQVLDVVVEWLEDQDTPLTELGREDRDVVSRAEIVDCVTKAFPGFSPHAVDRVLTKSLEPDAGTPPRLRKAGHGKYALPALTKETAA
jgi:hypothetical protein